MYDFAHCLSDYIEGITHSICTLEFEVHRPLYDWILENLDLPRPLPHQYEFARLSLAYTVMSKRKLMQLVNEKLVSGWDDPRMPTISGIRRRGVPATALCTFAYNIGITKYNGLTDVAVLEHAIREDLNKRALRRLAVLRPVKLVIENYPEGKVEELDAVNNPEDESAGKRKIPFSRELYIERSDLWKPPFQNSTDLLHSTKCGSNTPTLSNAIELLWTMPKILLNCAAPPTSTAKPAARRRTAR
jgi:glutaminyl-tRNA synthetase